jgi:hypothetical protein
VAGELLDQVTKKTPKKTGRLQGAWNIGKVKKHGSEYYIEVYNNVEYAEPVEYGHRTRGGSFVKGAHMMELSLQELQQHLPDYLREWMNDFINTHELM